VKLRGRLVVIHRWLGLTAALFLVITGLTGTILAWEHELDAWLAPHLHEAKAPRLGMPLMDGLALRQHVAGQLGPQVQVLSVELHGRADQAVRLSVRAAPHAPALPYDQVYANPYSGALQGHRDSAHLHWGREYILPFLFQLHCALALPDPWGAHPRHRGLAVDHRLPHRLLDHLADAHRVGHQASRGLLPAQP
jgi:uncharacterized iron-regulated membrane protein